MGEIYTVVTVRKGNEIITKYLHGGVEITEPIKPDLKATLKDIDSTHNRFRFNDPKIRGLETKIDREE